MDIRVNLIHEPSPGFECMDPSRTQQQFKEECDVNNIIERYVNAGIPITERTDAIYGDFADMPQDFGEMVNIVNDARQKFADLPSNIRDRFDNDPIKLVEFMQDETNLAEAVKLGLVAQKDPKDPSAE